MKRKTLMSLILLIALLTASITVASAGDNASIGINVVLNVAVTDDILSDLGSYGKVRDVLYEIDALTMKIKASELSTIQGLSYVAAANPDAERYGSPIDTVAVEDFAVGFSTWNLDVINVTTGPGLGTRQVAEDGTGVYVAVLDSGLLKTWRQYFPEERIAEEYAICFGGGGGEVGTVSTQPNKWGLSTSAHGTHVTSTIIGYNFRGAPINGVAPLATIIPVKVLNNPGWGWSSMVARGITYIADLKADELADSPVVINMSLGGPELDAMEKKAIDYAIVQGVIIVASAGNEGAAGMGYPGAYEPVISVAASGWFNEWAIGPWWYALDVTETDPQDEFYITDFSSRAVGDQDLDLAAPGSWIVGPYQLQMGQLSYYYLGGTSMASPHVAGTVALMAQKKPALTASEAEGILESTALGLPGWGADATGAGLLDATAALDDIP